MFLHLTLFLPVVVMWYTTMRGLIQSSANRNSVKQLKVYVSHRYSHVKYQVQVNLFQKHLFLHQLTHNMTKDCSLSYKFSTRKLQAQNMLRTWSEHVVHMNCSECQIKQKQKNNLCTPHVLSLQFSCSELIIHIVG